MSLQPVNALIDIEKRAQEIKVIEQNIADINHIFKDLSDIVREQDDYLNNIEEHIEHTTLNTKKATQELKKAYSYGRLGATMTAGLMGAAVAGPIGFLAGIKSSIALAGLSLSTGFVSYKVSAWMY